MENPVEHHLRVERHARWVEVGGQRSAPADPDDERWVVLHGYGQLATRFLRHFEGIAGPRVRVVAPEGLSRLYLDSDYRRVGASWMTREDREYEIVDTVAYLDALTRSLDERDGAPGRTVVLGFSQGAHAAARWLARGRTRADRLICWGSGLPEDVDLARCRDHFAALDLTFVVGERDEYLTKARLDHERRRMDSAGLPYRWLTYDGGHRIDGAVVAALAQP